MTDPAPGPFPATPPPPPNLARAGTGRRAALACAVFFGACGLAALFAWGTGYAYRPVTPALAASHMPPPPPDLAGAGLEEASAKARKTLDKLAPKGPFIIIDRVQNRLYLRDGSRVLLDAVVSAGAGSVLEDPSGKRKWVFDTPVGRFKVKGRRENPLWTAPDWEYIESGEPLPRRYSDRVQEGMLGEYALDLDTPGYMIHGTLYTRLLGRNVSHGCIRVGRDDLRVLWQECPIGTTVFIY